MEKAYCFFCDFEGPDRSFETIRILLYPIGTDMALNWLEGSVKPQCAQVLRYQNETKGLQGDPLTELQLASILEPYQEEQD